MQPLFFDASVDPMVTQETPERGQDILHSYPLDLTAQMLEFSGKRR